MTPIRKLPPGYVAPPITPKPRPAVNPGPLPGPRPRADGSYGGAPPVTGGPKPAPVRPPRPAESIAREAKHTLKYGQSLPMQKGTGPSAYAKAMGLKKGGKTTTLHSITKSSKKSNW